MQNYKNRAFERSRQELEFLNNLWGWEPSWNRVVVTGPPGYTAWQNWFLGIDSWAS